MTVYLFKVAKTVTTWEYIVSPDVATIEDAWAGGIINQTNSQLANIVHGTNLDGRSEGTIV